MLEYTLKRLHVDNDDSRVYHLFDRDGGLRLVADYGSPWLSDKSERFVNFATASGKTLATMDLAATATKYLGGRHNKDYAVVLDHAVYAIFSEYRVTEGDERLYFVIRVADQLWLALHEESEEPLYSIYNEVPASFMSRSVEPIFSDLPEPAGKVERGIRQFDFSVVWRETGLEHPGVIVGALLFLVDRAGMFDG